MSARKTLLHLVKFTKNMCLTTCSRTLYIHTIHSYLVYDIYKSKNVQHSLRQTEILRVTELDRKTLLSQDTKLNRSCIEVLGPSH